LNNLVIPEDMDVESAKFRLTYGINSRVSFEGYEALQDKANIVDKRNKFF
jgi:hypothetical protein